VDFRCYNLCAEAKHLPLHFLPHVGHTAPVLIAFCNMAACREYVKSEFPLIDDDLYQYVEGT